MIMEGFLALTIICIIFSIGDYISMKTRAMCSMMFVASVLLLVGFQIGFLPANLFTAEASVLQPMGGVLIGFLIVHMGTLLNLKEFVAQWRTVVIGMSVMVFIGLVLVFAGPLFIDSVWAISAAPPLAGGVVASIVMGQGGIDMGMPEIAVFTALLVSFQGFVGFPLISVMLKRQAVALKREFAQGARVQEAKTSPDKSLELPWQFPKLPEGIRDSSNVLLAKLGIATSLAMFLADATGGVVHRLVMCLFVGVALKWVGFLEEGIMLKANTFGFAMITLLTIVYANLATVSLEQLFLMTIPIIIVFLLGIIAIILGSIVTGKILKVPISLAIAIGASALSGFPGTYIISSEVSKSMGQTPDEEKYILDSILPQMLVGGFVTVTVGSVIMAGIMVNLLYAL